MDSLPFNYDNASLALSPRLSESVEAWFLHTSQTAPVESSGPSGQFYSKDGQPIDPPLSSKAEPPTSANQYGYLLNNYGERGDRLVWLAYTAGARQAF